MAPGARTELEAEVAALGDAWFHSIDLGDGIVTPGRKSAGQLSKELEALRLPDLTGKSVLDIGAWDGYFSFAAEQRGASRVVALDHYVWSIDFEARFRVEAECRARGVAPRPWEESPEVWRPDSLPGRAGFDLAHRALDSKVEPVVADLMTVDLDELGTFDIVLFLGVLYHLRDPLEALTRVAALTRELAVIETALIATPGYDRFPLCQFFPSDELAKDPTNWWAPNMKALAGMCTAVGFRRVEANGAAAHRRLRRRLSLGVVGRQREVVRAWR
ncbi:MAG: tRNA (mo5U34)-methyltransferase [Acidimicrobiaceae bacterium]|jgi:tRNA (mo5U34)-methyltransferase